MRASMLKVFLKQLAKVLSFEEAADTTGAEAPDQLEYLRRRLSAKDRSHDAEALNKGQEL